MAASLRASYSLAGLFSRSLALETVSSARVPDQTISSTFRLSIHPLLPLLPTITVPLRLPQLLGDIWESVLRAVPKKKTSHRKKRQRFLAGKALENVTALNKCPACGTVKKAHFLCPWCVREIQNMWKGKEPKAAEAK